MQITVEEWKEFLRLHADAHLLQTAEWGELKSQFGWKAVRILCGQAGAQVLFRLLPGGFSIAYLPKGPVGFNVELFNEIDRICHDNHAVFLKVEPNAWEPWVLNDILAGANWLPSRSIQPRRTVMVSLEGSEETILGRMKQKTRYNIRLAEKKDVVVKPSTDVESFHWMALQTSERDAFGVHRKEYYQKVYDLFHPVGACELLTAEYDSQPLASIFVMARGEYAYYMYGASSNAERNRMPTYLVQWEAMKWAKAHGCKWYDLWGIPDLEEDELETSFSQRHAHDGLWGVYRFKRGFGGETWRSVGAWDKVYNQPLYWLYQRYLKLRGGGMD